MRPIASLRCALVAGLLTGQAPSAAADVSEASYGAWTVRCETPTAGGAQACIMLQNLVLVTDDGQPEPVLQFAVGMAPGAANPTVLLRLPLGISLPPGVTIRIDGGAPATFPVERCKPDGCDAGMRLRDTTVAQLREASGLEITFYDGEGQSIGVPLSLDGFDAAFTALRRHSTSAPGASP